MAETQGEERDMACLPLPQLPDIAIANILRNLDAVSLCQIAQTSRDFRTMSEHIARQRVMDRFEGDEETATRFKYLSWKERLYLEEDTPCGFDTDWYNEAGFAFTTPDKNIKKPGTPNISLAGMGPKLLISDISTADQRTIRWRLRVSGNTAVEFGCIPVGVAPSHTALHKCQPVPLNHEHRCTGFSSQITAGSLLPVKVPIMRGTELDLVAKRGLLQLVLRYPSGAKEISWQNGQPVARLYRGPRKLRFELELPDDVDVKLGLTAWAKASFDILAVPISSLNSTVKNNIILHHNDENKMDADISSSINEERTVILSDSPLPGRTTSLFTNNDNPLMVRTSTSMSSSPLQHIDSSSTSFTSPSTSFTSSSPSSASILQVPDPPALFLSVLSPPPLSDVASLDGTPSTMLTSYDLLSDDAVSTDTSPAMTMREGGSSDSEDDGRRQPQNLPSTRVAGGMNATADDSSMASATDSDEDHGLLSRSDSQCNGLILYALDGQVESDQV